MAFLILQDRAAADTRALLTVPHPTSLFSENVSFKRVNSLTVLSSNHHDTLGVSSRLEGGEQSLSVQLTALQHGPAVVSDHLPHQRLPQSLMGHGLLRLPTQTQTRRRAPLPALSGSSAPDRPSTGPMSLPSCEPVKRWSQSTEAPGSDGEGTSPTYNNQFGHQMEEELGLVSTQLPCDLLDRGQTIAPRPPGHALPFRYSVFPWPAARTADRAEAP